MISLRSKITQAVLGHLFLHENESLYVNEMARFLSVDSGNLTRKLTELEKEGILKSHARGNQRYYSLNPNYALLGEYRKIVLKTIGFEHVLKQALKKVAGIRKAVLFGSYAADRMDASSDIDLLVVGNHNTLDLQRVVVRVQRTINREINVVSMGTGEYEGKRSKDPFLRSVEKNKKVVVL
jgi:predicted nucleotidyltransferase